MPFHSALQVTRTLAKAGDCMVWRLDGPLVYESQAAGQILTVPAGFETDFASVPRLPLAYLAAGDTAHEAAVVHDWLYVTRILDRETADAVFKEAMAATNIAWWRRSLMWAAVRLFGGSFDPMPEAP